MKKYVKADISDLSEESVETRILLAADPKIRPSVAERLATDKDPRVRYALSQNKGVPAYVYSMIDRTGLNPEEVMLGMDIYGDIDALGDGLLSQVEYAVTNLGGVFVDAQWGTYNDEDGRDVEFNVWYQCLDGYYHEIGDAIEDVVEQAGFEVYTKDYF